MGDERSDERLYRELRNLTELDSGGTSREQCSNRQKYPRTPDCVGPFKILEILGEGGFGVVYLAEQSKPVRRRVALKIIKPGMDSKAVIARFEVEQQALALMNHPNIAKVIDAGVTEEQRPYFVMEHVSGVSITKYCDQNRLNTTERLKLFADVCSAVQHAHQKGIIHRDIKPSNVLVTVSEGKAVPKVIDFGVAKATQQHLTERTLFTERGQLIGTPEYMSPEQAEMTGLDIDTRTDIYSLGVLLYELLTGALPFDPKSLREAGFAEIQRIIREQEPPKPSTRLSNLGDESGKVASNRQAEIGSLTRQLRGDLDWITMKALEKDRTRRYDNANELAMEIKRYLNHEPVLSGPPSARYRLGKFLRRNKGAAVAVAAVFLTLTTGITLSDFQRRRAWRAEELAQRRLEDAIASRNEAESFRTVAEVARDEAEAVTNFLTDTLASVDPEKQGKEVTVREVLDVAAGKIERAFADRPLVEARIRKAVGWTYRSLGLYDRAKEHLAAAAAMYRKELGERDRRTLAAISSLAVVIGDHGDYSAAEASQRGTLEIQRRGLGEEHQETLASMNNLANTLYDRGRYAEAEKLYRQTLEIQRCVFGEEHPDTLSALGNLSGCLNAQVRFGDAEPLCRQLLEHRRRVLGDEHPDTIRSMNDLANNLYGQGRYAEAERLYRQTLELRRGVLGKEHPDTLASMNNLANSLADQAHYAEAEALYLETLQLQHRVLGEKHPDALLSKNNLAVSLKDQRRFAEAESLCRQTLEIRRHVLGEEHPEVAETLHNLSETLEQMQRWTEAERLCRQAGTIWAAALPPEHRDRRYNDNVLGGILTGLGRYGEAEAMLVESYQSLRDGAGLHPTEKAAMLERLVRLYESWDASEPGKGYAQKAAEWRVKLVEGATEPRSDGATEGED